MHFIGFKGEFKEVRAVLSEPEKKMQLRAFPRKWPRVLVDWSVCKHVRVCSSP